jgi:hypothetical protein
MTTVIKELKKEIVEELKKLSGEDMQELHNFVVFLKMKNFLPQIDPSQAYFWTKKWQKMEKEANEDIKNARIFGPFESAKELLKQLKK